MSRADAGNSQRDKDVDTLATPNTSQSNEREPFLVLIAEDEEPIAEAIAMLVEDCGYTPILASNGRQALELARRRQPALIITDLMMPYLDGDELITTLKGDAARNGYTAPPTILLSAAGLRRMKIAGADVLLPKPFELDELEALLHRFLGPPPNQAK